jgi:thiamine transport system substrate-binding protein
MVMMRLSILMLALGLALARPAAAETLTIYTYNAFTSKYGPGPAIKRAFEASCACTLDFVALDDGVTILNRLKLEGRAAKADIVLGLDANLIAEARALDLVAPHGQDLGRLALPVAWTDDRFLPFDWAPFAVVYDSQSLGDPPASLAALVAGDPSRKIVIEDPRTSAPGLGLVLWMRAVYGDQAAAAWERLKDRVLTVTKGWSEAYGLFTKGEAPMVLSYLTSPAYHRVVEKSDRYRALRFAEGNYLQIEVAARLSAAPQPALAARFMSFVLAPGFQDAVPTGNWMYPVVAGVALPAGFDPPAPDLKALLLPSETVAARRRAWTEEWRAAMSR